jgi:hypothetical protein
MASTAANTRKSQDDLVKSLYDSLTHTRTLAEKCMAEHKNQRTNWLDTADIARRLLANWVDQTAGIDGFQKKLDEVLALAQAHILVSEDLKEKFVEEWKQVRPGA